MRVERLEELRAKLDRSIRSLNRGAGKLFDIPELTLATPSVYSPAAGHESPEPAWKSFDLLADVVPPRRPTANGRE